MKKLFYFKCIIIAAVVSVYTTSCTTDVDLSKLSGDVKIDQSLVLPIGETTISVGEILTQFAGQGILLSKSDNEIYFQTFDSTEYSFANFDFASYAVPLQRDVPLPTSTYIAGSNIPVFTDDQFIDLGVNRATGTQVKTLSANSASVDVTVDVSPDLKWINPSDITIEMDFLTPNMVIAGGVNPSCTPTVWGGVNHVTIPSFTINNDSSGVYAKTLPYTLKATMKKQALNVNMVAGVSYIKLNIKFTNIDFTVAYGSFDPGNSASTKKQFSLNLDKYVPGSMLRYVDPQIIIREQTDAGVNMLMSIDSLKAYVASNPSKYHMCSFGGSTKTTKAIVGPSTLGAWTSDSLILNKANGRTDILLDTFPDLSAVKTFLYPDVISYNFSFKNNTTNPKALSFVTPTSKMKVNIETRLPFYFNPGSKFSLTDTIRNVKSSIGTSFDAVPLETAAIVLTIYNGIPAKGTMTMTFYDSNNNVINTSIQTQLPVKINSPVVDANGDVVVSKITAQTMALSLNSSQMDDLKKTEYITYTLLADGLDPKTTLIHFTQQNNFRVKMGVYLKANGVTTVSKK